MGIDHRPEERPGMDNRVKGIQVTDEQLKNNATEDEVKQRKILKVVRRVKKPAGDKSDSGEPQKPKWSFLAPTPSASSATPSTLSAPSTLSTLPSPESGGGKNSETGEKNSEAGEKNSEKEAEGAKGSGPFSFANLSQKGKSDSAGDGGAPAAGAERPKALFSFAALTRDNAEKPSVFSRPSDNNSANPANPKETQGKDKEGGKDTSPSAKSESANPVVGGDGKSGGFSFPKRTLVDFGTADKGGNGAASSSSSSSPAQRTAFSFTLPGNNNSNNNKDNNKDNKDNKDSKDSNKDSANNGNKDSNTSQSGKDDKGGKDKEKVTTREEDGAVLFSLKKAKLYTFSEASKWAELGLGSLSISRDEQGRVRAIARVLGSLRVILNTILIKGKNNGDSKGNGDGKAGTEGGDKEGKDAMRAELAGDKTVRFGALSVTGEGEGGVTSALFLARVQSKEEAVLLRDAMHAALDDKE